MERTDELKERIRQQPLNDRLEESRRRIGDMCSKGRCPKMTIPVQHDDDDFYINTTLADAQATIAALQDIIKQMGGQAAVLAKDAMSAKEQVAALQARVQELCKFRVADHEQLAEVQKYWRESQDEAHELRKQLTQRTAELEAAKQNFDRRTDECNEISKMYVEAHAELERVRAERDEHLENLGLCKGNELAAELDTLKALIAALPKVEGAVVVSNGYVKDSTRWHALFGADEDAALYAALLQHRQGMEG